MSAAGHVSAASIVEHAKVSAVHCGSEQPDAETSNLSFYHKLGSE